MLHGFVSRSVLRETDGDVGRIGVLHKMALLLSYAHEAKHDLHTPDGSSVHRDDKRLVGTPESALEVLPYRLLRRPRTRVLIEHKGKRIDVFNFQVSTLWICFVCEIDT